MYARWFVILAVGTAAALPGCGDDDGSEDTAPADTAVVVPEVTSLPLAEARRAIADAGLLLQTRRKVAELTPGEVLSQDPTAGTRVDRGSTVNLIVATPRPRSGAFSCGDLFVSGAGSYHVRATGVDCETATVIARQWGAECAPSRDGPCKVTLGFACTYDRTGPGVNSISCVAGDRRVVFESGA